ncbi:MAG: hypothetical protein J1G06_04365 [Oscillospiraceae bacterium]|nr:hypothetical protein [Oscillospiraceae bacterium]
MMKNSKILRYILISASYVFLTAVFFLGGYYTGFKSGGSIINESAAEAIVPAAAAPVAETNLPQQYRVILEDSELRLYSDENGISRLISSKEISENSFPTRDVAVLKEGVTFNRTQDALTFMENFLS